MPLSGVPSSWMIRWLPSPGSMVKFTMFSSMNIRGPGARDADHQAIEGDRRVDEVLDDIGVGALDVENHHVGVAAGVQDDVGRRVQGVESLELVDAAAGGVDVLDGQGAGGIV